MGDFLFKFRILIAMLRSAFGEWKRNVWGVGLDNQYCCDGRECGCMGVTNRELWSYQERNP